MRKRRLVNGVRAPLIYLSGSDAKPVPCGLGKSTYARTVSHPISRRGFLFSSPRCELNRAPERYDSLIPDSDP
jgi:hypothetical protein